MQDSYLKNYRPRWTAASALNVIKIDLKRTVLCQLCFINALFYGRGRLFEKQNSNYPVEIVASGHQQHVMILIFQTKSHPKCQLDTDPLRSQTFSHIAVCLLEARKEYCLHSLRCAQAFSTDTSHMSVRFYCECKCRHSTPRPGRPNVVFVFFLFLIEASAFLLLLPMHLIVSAFNDLNCSAVIP